MKITSISLFIFLLFLDFSPNKDIRSLIFQKDWQGIAKVISGQGELAQHPVYNFLAGYACYLNKDYEEAVSFLKSSLSRQSPLSGFSHYYLGKTFLEQGKIREAEKEFLQVLAQNYIYIPAQFELVKIWLRRVDIERSAKTIYQLRELRIPSWLYPDFLLLEAEFLKAQKKPKLAEEKIKELWINFPTSEPAQKITPPKLSPEQKLVRIKKLLAQKEFIKAQKELEELRSVIGRKDRALLSKIYGLLAQAYFMAKNYQKVVELEKFGKKYASKEARFWVYLAWAYHRLDEEKKAEKIYLKFLKELKKSPFAPQAVYHLARMNQLNGQFAKAIRYYQALLKRWQKNPYAEKAMLQMGLIYFEQKNFSKAKEIFEQAKNNFPLKPEFIYWLARSREKRGEIEQAGELKKQILKEFPDSFYAWLIDPAPQKESIARVEISAQNISARYDAVVQLAGLGLFGLAQKELDWQLSKGKPSASELLSLINKLTELDSYPLVYNIFYNQLLGILGSDQKKFYLSIIYPFGFSELIERYAREYQIEPALAYALVRAESGFDPTCTSTAGAIGLAQLMPRLGISLAERIRRRKITTSELYDPGLNINLGLYHFSELFDYFEYAGARWQMVLAICAYNAGKNPVKNWFEERGELEQDLWIELIPYAETRRYVKRVLSALRIYRAFSAV